MNRLQEQLSRILPKARIKSRLIDRIAYANDASYFRLVPQAVVQPNSISEIQALFKLSKQTRIPMTFRAAGTNLTGQAITDGMLVDISKHWDNYSVENDGALLRSQPGIIGGFLNNALKPYGRRIGPDPASIDACMLGGILSNNSGGMCCGVTENAYQTIQSMTIVLPNGFVLDTGVPDAAKIFENEQPHIAQGLLDIRRRILESPSPSGARARKGIGARGTAQNEYEGETLADRIRRRYQSKNTNGYTLNAFTDFDTPLDILVHLMIGSEGTLGFIAEAVLRTLPVLTNKYTALLYFKTVQDAAAAIFPLRESGARAAEILDRAALRSVEAVPGVPPILRELPKSAAAILVEYQAPDAESLVHLQKAAARTLKKLRLLHDPDPSTGSGLGFTQDPSEQANLWKARKGIIASVGAMRAPGTTSLIEDVLFPVPRLAEAVTDLQDLFATHGYAEGVIYGHAKDGNLHFQINQSFNTQSEIKRFDNFTRDLVHVVTGKYDGTLKAEHGSGRNMAPFVEAEWGAEAYAIMRDIKSLFDPDGLLNPGVLINPDPQAHITDAKSIASVSPIVDACIECGFCESKCPSRYLTLSPRQRIIVQREVARLRDSGVSDSPSPALPAPLPQAQVSEVEGLASLIDAYTYDGLDTCAVDGLCAMACPVSINTGELTRELRAERVKNEKVAGWVADNFALVEKSLGWGIRLGHLAQPRITRHLHRTAIGAVQVSDTKRKTFLASAAEVAGNITGTTLPKWNNSIPYPTTNFSALRELSGKKDLIYFPSCISRQLGVPRFTFQISGDEGVTHGTSHMALAEALITVALRANITLEIPKDIEGTCCGMPFSSKGYTETYKATLHKTIAKLWEWSEGGKYSIVIDTTSCAHSLRTCTESLSKDDLERYQQMTILDSLELIHDTLLPNLKVNPVDEDVVLHPNCSARKLGLDGKMLSIAQQCTRSATVPLNLGCCAFAGDRGLLHPELTASATAKEAAEVLTRNYGGYYSSNITCEMGMSEGTGKDYVGIVYLVEQATRP